MASQDLPAGPAPAKIGESRWPMALAVLAAGGLRAGLLSSGTTMPAGRSSRSSSCCWPCSSSAILAASTAFSPTDVSAIRPWAKLMMMAEEAISLLVAILVVSRAVNILR